MLVGRKDYPTVIAALMAASDIGFDTETTGLRPYHGDRPFALILATPAHTFYFNTRFYPGLPLEFVHGWGDIRVELASIFKAPSKTWYAHHAKFDMAMLRAYDIEIHGTIHCTKSIARVEYNDHHSYSLAEVASRRNLAKDEAVARYVEEHKLYVYRRRPGKKAAERFDDYTKVPLEIMQPYAEKDARLALEIGQGQRKYIEKESNALKDSDLPTLSRVAANERRLTETVARMERVGLRVDLEYCMRAARYELDRVQKSLLAFKRETGRDFLASPKLYAEIFASEKPLWEYTKKGNPSFESEALDRFKNPAAQIILDYRDAKSKSDFYEGFLYHADSNGDIHPHWNQDDTKTGRFASSGPNFQNLTAEHVLKCASCGKGHELLVPACEKCGSTSLIPVEYLIRRAIVPRPGYVFFMPDYVQMEYKMALDYACQVVGYLTELARRVNAGEDVHEVVNQLVKLNSGMDIGRSHAKNVNFAKIYGARVRKLAKMIGCSLEDAQKIWDAVAAVAPEFDTLMEAVSKTAVERGYIRNWIGRRSHFPDASDAYKALNSLIQGGCADVNKVALNCIDEYLLDMRSRLVATIHDEDPLEIHESEVHIVPKRVLELMVEAYPAKYVPMTVSAEWSERSLADKRKGLPA